MIKVYTKEKLLPTKNASYYSHKKSLTRKFSVQILVVAILSIVSLVVKQYHRAIAEDTRYMQSSYNMLLQEHMKTIKTNIDIEKALSDFAEIKNIENETSYPTILSEFKHMVSYLFYYYGVSENVEIKVMMPSKVTPKIACIKISMSFKTKRDSQTIPVIDSVIMNSKGFMFVERINISRESTGLVNNVDLYWYTSSRILETMKKETTLNVKPEKYPYALEDRYRISIWSGNIIN